MTEGEHGRRRAACCRLAVFASMIVLGRALPAPTLAEEPASPTVPQEEESRTEAPPHREPVTEPWRFHHYPELEELGVRCLVEDRDGSMWFGLDQGVMRYDGLKWTRFGRADGLTHAAVRGLAALRNGGVVAATRAGLYHWDGEQWRRVYPEASGWICPIEDVVEAPDGRVWAATPWGPLCWDGGTVEVYVAPDQKAVAAECLPGAILIDLPVERLPWLPWPAGTGVALIENHVVELSPGGPGARGGMQLHDAIVEDHRDPGKGPFGLMSRPGRRMALDVQSRNSGEIRSIVIMTEEVAGGRPHAGTMSVSASPEGDIWFGTSAATLLVRREGNDSTRPTWEHFDEDDGLRLGTRPTVLAESRDQVWAISRTNQGGVNRFDGRSWSHFRLSVLGGTDLNTTLLRCRDGSLWITGNGKIHRLQDRAWDVFETTELGMPGHRALLFETGEQQLWIAGYRQRVVRVDRQLGTRNPVNLRFAARGRGDAEWFIDAGNQHVVKREAASWTRWNARDGLMQFPQGILVSESCEIAFGTDRGRAAIARRNGERWTIQTFPDFAPRFSRFAAYVDRRGRFWLAGEASSRATAGSGNTTHRPSCPTRHPGSAKCPTVASSWPRLPALRFSTGRSGSRYACIT